MTRGRVPMPDNVRELRGNPGKRRSPKRAVLPPVSPEPPGWLSAEAAAEWGRVVPELERHGFLARVDRAVLSAYCTAWARFVQAEAEIDQLVVEGHRGIPRKHPAWQMWRESAGALAQLGKELFLTPNARLRSVIRTEGADGDQAAEAADILD